MIENMVASGDVGKLQHLVESVARGLDRIVFAALMFHFGEASIKFPCNSMEPMTLAAVM